MSKEAWLAQKRQEGASVSDEVLQKAADPVEELRKLGDKAAVCVPYEYLWPPELKPFTNPDHKRNYDADLLARHLEEAGYRSHVIRVIQAGGWSWLSAEAIRILNSKERRQLRRAKEQTSTQLPAASSHADKSEISP